MSRLALTGIPALLIGATLLVPLGHFSDNVEAALLMALFVATAVALPIVLHIIEAEG